MADAVRLPDGNVAIVNAGAHQIRIVGVDGRTVRTLGQKGGGPGEFQAPAWIGERGDTLVVADVIASRVSRFLLDGTFLGSWQFPPAAGMFPQVVGQYRDGTLLVASDEAAAAARSGAVRGRTALLRLRPDGSLLDTLAVVPSSDQFVSTTADGRGVMVRSLPFGRRTLLAMWNDVIYVGTGERPTLRTIDARGESGDLLHVSAATRPVTPRDVDDYWEKLITDGSRERSRPEGIPYPRLLPPYSDLHVDRAGRIWVGLSRLPREWDAPATYYLHSPTGTPLARVQLPGRASILDAGPDWVLLRERGEDHREMVSLYPIVQR